MGSERDVKPGDEVRRCLLAVRNIGFDGASQTMSLDQWRAIVYDLVDAIRKEELRNSTC